MLEGRARGIAASRFGSAVVDVSWSFRHLSTVECFDLEDGRRIVAKTRPYHDRLQTCLVVHRCLWEGGYHCSQPLSEVLVEDGTAITFESFVEDGPSLDVGPPSSQASAQALAELVGIATGTAVRPGGLHPPVPWVWWDHEEDGLWPLPDDLSLDLNDVAGPASLDDAALRLRKTLGRYVSPPSVIGHGDWETQNVFWQGGRLHAVHDWDSVVERSEPFIIGPAAAVHGVVGSRPGQPQPRQMYEFIHAYMVARNLEWTAKDMQACLAAGLWVHVFNAKKAVVAGDVRAIDDPYMRQVLMMIEEIVD